MNVTPESWIRILTVPNVMSVKILHDVPVRVLSECEIQVS